MSVPSEEGVSEAGVASPPVVRPPVAVVVSRFPLVTETFVLREIEELESQGQPVRLVPLLRESPPVVHPEARPWVRRALYTPYLSRSVLAANLRALGRHPAGYPGLLLRLLAGSVTRPGVLVRTLALFPKAVYLGERLAAEGVRHLHAHFATYPATSAWVASRLFKLTFSFTVHAHDLFVHRSLLAPKVREARFVRAISHFNRELLERLYAAARADRKVTVIHMGIEPERYGSGEGPRGAEDGAETPAGAPARLLCVAALKPYKGLPVLLAACEALATEGRSFVCEVVGEGPDRRRLEREIRRRGLGGGTEGSLVRLLGALPQEQVARRLERADVFVLPSVVAKDGQMEGLPVVLMEALAARRPTVATRLSGIPELVEDGVTGLLVEPGDPGELVTAIRRLLDDPGLAKRLAEAGRRRVEEQFDVRSTAAALAARLDEETGELPAEAIQLSKEALLLPGGGEARVTGKGGTGALGLRRFHESPDARVAELVIPVEERGKGGRAPRKIVIKQPRDRPGQSRPPRERARWEHQVLTRLQGSGVAVPRPLNLEEEPPALVMEAVEGTPLDELIRRSRWGRSSRFLRLERAFHRTGIWLREFQEATRGPRGVGRHGDLWPGNVRVREVETTMPGATGSEPAVTVLDLEGFEDGAAPTDDAARFLVTSGLYLVAPLLGGRRRRLENAFLQGWGLGLEEVQRRGLERAKARVARRLLADGGVSDGILAHRRRRWLARLTRRLDGTAERPGTSGSGSGSAP